MRISVLTLGTRGDTEPFIALGAGLREAGHEVRLAALSEYADQIRAQGLGFVALPGAMADMFATPAWRNLKVTSTNWRQHARALREMLEPLVRQIEPRHIAAACDDSDAIVFSPTTNFGYRRGAELGIPAIKGTLGPSEPTWQFPHPLLASRTRAGRLGNRLSYVVAERLMRDSMREPIKPSRRRELGFSALPLRGTSERWPPYPIISGYSPTLVPRPPDWPQHIHQSGFWLTTPPAGVAIPPEVEEFLAAGPPPVYVSFGSMRPGESGRLLEAVLAGCSARGLRVVLGSGFGEAGREVERDDVLLAEELPHHLVLPRFRAFVHHGGAGTTARGLAAGLPTFIVPFVFDQVFWGHRVHVAGAGPEPVPRHELSAERFAAALDVLERPETRSAAQGLATQLAAERGVDQAVRLVERLSAGRGA